MATRCVCHKRDVATLEFARRVGTACVFRRAVTKTLAAMKLPISEEFRVTSALPAGANVCESALVGRGRPPQSFG